MVTIIGLKNKSNPFYCDVIGPLNWLTEQIDHKILSISVENEA